MLVKFKVDLHMHTVLSPCGSLEMSPSNIVSQALSKGLDIIGVTDHNTTRQCEVLMRLGQERGLVVLCGAEVTTEEEVHCLTFFEDFEKLNAFQSYLDKYLPDTPNDPERFGDQVWVDEQEQILGVEDRMLINAISQTVEEVAEEVRRLEGIFILAHVDRPRFSLYSQLGFMPSGLRPDGVELSPLAVREEQEVLHPELRDFTLLCSSDAHQLDAIAKSYSYFYMRKRSFEELRLAFQQREGRKIVMEKEDKKNGR